MTNLRRFFAPPEQWAGDRVVLDREETHHLSRVLRLAEGDRVAVCDGQGRAATAVVRDLASAGGAVLSLEEEMSIQAESPLAVTLGLGLAKGEAVEQVVRQATEMGVQRLIPFVSTYSEKISPDRAARRSARWQRQARESLKSSQRLYLPEISAVQDFPAVLPGPEEVKFLCYEAERDGGLVSCFNRPRPAGVRVLIGPEGGFTPEEVAQAQGAGFQVVSLGPRRLRVETAALTALALLQYAWGDLA
jgi:16S rRNA (uracil1498-N3)-methyltransferase